MLNGKLRNDTLIIVHRGHDHRIQSRVVLHMSHQFSQSQLPSMLPGQMPHKIVPSTKCFRTISAVCSRSPLNMLCVIMSVQIALISKTFPAYVAPFWLLQLSSLFSIGPSVLTLVERQLETSLQIAWASILSYPASCRSSIHC